MVQIAGILNVTPDSFSDGGNFVSSSAAVERGLAMHEEGADWIDVGGESTRPGSESVGAKEECRRVLPVVSALAEAGLSVSIDTQKPLVAREALAAGASVVNDVNGLRAEGMLEVIAQAGAGAVIMHMRGTPKTMQDNIRYGNLIDEVKGFLKTQLLEARAVGIDPIWLDPGIGFGKSVEQNCLLIAHLRHFKAMGAPIYVGASRKSFIGRLTGAETPQARLPGSLGAAVAAAEAGADVLRVHDVKETWATIKVWEAVRSSRPQSGL